MTPVFIPSKGRANTIKTPFCFQSLHFGTAHDIYVVVEPQEYKLYDGKNYNLLVLPENDKGIAYVRNWILERAIANGIEKYWMMDDDISQFLVYEDSRGSKIFGEEACGKAEKLLHWNVPNLGQAALEYSQFAWSQSKEVISPGYCDVAVLMFPKKVKSLRYRPEMNLKEDRDFTLQVLNAGMLSARTAKIAFVAPRNGSNAGGLKEMYQKTQGREAQASMRMVKAWPGICEPNVKKDGRPDVKINWKCAFKPSPSKGHGRS